VRSCRDARVATDAECKERTCTYVSISAPCRWVEERALFADAPIDQLAYDVQVSDVSRILLEQVREDPAQRGRIGGESAAQLGPIGELCIASRGFGTRGYGGQSGTQACHRVLGHHDPTRAIRILITARIGHLLSLETPLHPAPLNEDQVPQESKRGPAGWHDVAVQLLGAQSIELGQQGGP
jgi:hypothetical protein